MSTDYNERIADKERWLAGMPDEEVDGRKVRPTLLSTAAMLRGAIQSVDVPHGAEETSLRRVLAAWEERSRIQTPSPSPLARPPSFLGGLMRVVFAFWRRR
jgi:hypothetical protein